MFNRYLDSCWIWIAVGFVTTTVVATLCQVLFRYVFHLPLAWTEELARIAMICGVYAALTPAYLRGEHIVVDFFLRLLPKPILSVTIKILKIVAFLVFGFIAYGAYNQMISSWKMPLVSVPSITIGMVYAVQMVSLVSVCVATMTTWNNSEVYLAAEIGGQDK